MSCTANNSKDKYEIQNQIGQVIVNRIIKAIDNNQKYRVIVVLPLLPGFEGEIGSGYEGIMKIQLHYE